MDNLGFDSRRVEGIYEMYPGSKDTKVLNMYNIFNLKSDTVNELLVGNFIFKHIRRRWPNIY